MYFILAFSFIQDNDMVGDLLLNNLRPLILKVHSLLTSKLRSFLSHNHLQADSTTLNCDNIQCCIYTHYPVCSFFVGFF